jgi:hypothetical protein
MQAVSMGRTERDDAMAQLPGDTTQRPLAASGLALYRANAADPAGTASPRRLRAEASWAAISPEQFQLMRARSVAVRSGRTGPRLPDGHGSGRGDQGNGFAVTLGSAISGTLLGAGIGIAVGLALVRFLS